MSSTSGLLYTAFNNAVVEFLRDVSSTFPGCKPISAAREFYEMGIKANKRAPLTLIHDLMMVPYGEHIRAHDEAFFMDHDYAGDLARAGGNGGHGGVAPSGQDVIVILKGLWKDMTPEDKSCVFQHLDVIVDLYDTIQSSPAMM